VILYLPTVLHRLVVQGSLVSQGPVHQLEAILFGRLADALS
jgi:hypothetical protein